LKEEVHSCRREPQGQLARNRRVTHHRSSALDHLLAAETRNKIRKSPIKVKKETLVKRQYLSSGNFIFGMDLLQHRTQSSSENVIFPHRPPPLEIDSQRSEGEIGRDRQGKV
jgi:hypothetical protein